jgi:hypothetical protein
MNFEQPKTGVDASSKPARTRVSYEQVLRALDADENLSTALHVVACRLNKVVPEKAQTKPIAAETPPASRAVRTCGCGKRVRNNSGVCADCLSKQDRTEFVHPFRLHDRENCAHYTSCLECAVGNKAQRNPTHVCNADCTRYVQASREIVLRYESPTAQFAEAGGRACLVARHCGCD